MPRRCKTCAHPMVAAIDNGILGNVPYTQIASKFDLHHKSIHWHSKHHLQPIIVEANERAKASIVSKMLEYREEVNYSTLDKVKMLQNRILNDLDATPKIADRVPLYREFRGALQEQAKLGGEYQDNQENQAKEQRTIKAVLDFLAENPNYDRDVVIETFAAGRGISRERIIELLGMIG